jgi:hypothetical protein
MPPRTVALVAAVCVTIGWLLAATLTPPLARVQSRPERPQRPPAVAQPAPFTGVLNLRLREAPPPPTTGRNPFSFGTRTRSAPPSERIVSPELEPPPAANSAGPSGPVYSLSGIGIAGDLRTAVLTDGQDVRIVKIDDVIGGYTVVEITDSSVTLASETARYTLRFAH